MLLSSINDPVSAGGCSLIGVSSLACGSIPSIQQRWQWRSVSAGGVHVSYLSYLMAGILAAISSALAAYQHQLSRNIQYLAYGISWLAQAVWRHQRISRVSAAA